jgi:hypothetical protein
MSTVAYEMEYKDAADWESNWAEWSERPSTPEFMEKWNKLVLAHGKSELWTLVE